MEETGKKVLDTFKQILSDTSNTQNLSFKTAVLQRWGQQYGFTINSNPQDYPCEYLQEIERFVENHFPTLPSKGSQGCHDELKNFLNNTEKTICNEVLRLTPLLKDSGLLVPLKDSYSRHLFTTLDPLLNSDLSVKEIYWLISWGRDVFFRYALPLFFFKQFFSVTKQTRDICNIEM